MDATTAGPHLTERLAELLEPREEVLEACLLGSRARGRAQPHGDCGSTPQDTPPRR